MGAAPDLALGRFDEVARVASKLVDPADYADSPHIAPNHIESETGRLLPFGMVSEDGVTSAKHQFFAGQVLYSKIRPSRQGRRRRFRRSLQRGYVPNRE